MAKIAIVYHSGFGHTKVLAEHVQKGVQQVAGVSADIFTAESVTDDVEKLNDYDAMIFGSPTYMGSVSAPFKAFMDATSKVWYSQSWKDKLASGFTNSGSMSGDKFNTLVQLVTLAAQHNMIWVPPGAMGINEAAAAERPAGAPAAVNRIGSFLGAMAQSDNNVPADKTPPQGDLLTAEHLGKRVAEAALRWNK